MSYHLHEMIFAIAPDELLVVWREEIFVNVNLLVLVKLFTINVATLGH